MSKTNQVVNNTGPLGFIFLLVFIGAAIYFIAPATNFWEVIVGFLKACIWPLLLTLHVFEMIQL